MDLIDIAPKPKGISPLPDIALRKWKAYFEQEAAINYTSRGQIRTILRENEMIVYNETDVPVHVGGHRLTPGESITVPTFTIQ